MLVKVQRHVYNTLADFLGLLLITDASQIEYLYFNHHVRQILIKKYQRSIMSIKYHTTSAKGDGDAAVVIFLRHVKHRI